MALWSKFPVCSVLLLVLCGSLCVAAGDTAASNQWCVAPQCSSLELLAEFVEVDYDWSGSGFAGRADAIARGAFVPENNLLTGINWYQNTVFICVPRWRNGVPSTLNTLQINETTGEPFLRPYPNWAWQSVLHYVQAVYVDRVRGNIWIIDTGRENFYNNNSDTIQNRAASLIVLNIANESVLVNITFPNDIFPFNSSFLNDIRVDPSGTRAFMTDTNLAGLGAVVALDITTGYARRVANPTTLVQSGYVVDVGGKSFPGVQAPSDGIAISPDGAYLYYSVITGSKIFRVPTAMLLDASVSDQAILDATTVLFDKGTTSDGMDLVDISSPLDDGTTNVAILYGGFVNDSFVALPFAPDVQRVDKTENPTQTLSESVSRLQWIDTIVADRHPTDANSVVTYFTSNRLQQYVFWTMDFSGNSGSNMRVWKMVLPRAPPSGAGNGGSSNNQAPMWSIVVMSVLGALLGAVLALYWVIRAKAAAPGTLSSKNLRESAPLNAGSH